MFDELRINLILLLLNIISLGNFVYPPRNELLIILVAFMIFPVSYSIKLKMRIVTLLSIIASFMTIQIVCEICCITALGLAINTAYQLDLTQGPALINTALGLSQILSYLSRQLLQKNTINRDITLLIFTLPNLFLCFPCQPITSKVLYLINPFLDEKWLYSVGFVLGIYTASLTSVEKHYKFFAIAVILLLEANFQSIQFIAGILAFLRGLLVYTQHTHQSQMYFLLGFLVFKVLLKRFLLYFMFIGYLVIGVILMQQAKIKKEKRNLRKDEAVGTKQLVIQEMYELQQFKTN